MKILKKQAEPEPEAGIPYSPAGGLCCGTAVMGCGMCSKGLRRMRDR